MKSIQISTLKTHRNMYAQGKETVLKPERNHCFKRCQWSLVHFIFHWNFNTIVCQIPPPNLIRSDEASFSSVNLIGRFSKFIPIMLSESAERETNMHRMINFPPSDSPIKDVSRPEYLWGIRTIFGSDLINHLRPDTVSFPVYFRHQIWEILEMYKQLSFIANLKSDISTYPNS